MLKSPLWTRPKNEISEEEYREFYHHVAHDLLTAFPVGEDALRFRRPINGCGCRPGGRQNQ